MTIYQRAIETFGEKAQLMMAIEEMAELTQAISKMLRGKEHNIEEEIADVEIMIEQLKEIFDKYKINAWKANKIQKLEKLCMIHEEVNQC